MYRSGRIEHHVDTMLRHNLDFMLELDLVMVGQGTGCGGSVYWVISTFDVLFVNFPQHVNRSFLKGKKRNKFARVPSDFL